MKYIGFAKTKPFKNHCFFDDVSRHIRQITCFLSIAENNAPCEKVVQLECGGEQAKKRTNKPTNKQTNKPTNKQTQLTHKQTYKQTSEQANKQIKNLRHRQTISQAI